jgi:hypothetical protein
LGRAAAKVAEDRRGAASARKHARRRRTIGKRIAGGDAGP